MPEPEFSSIQEAYGYLIGADKARLFVDDDKLRAAKEVVQRDPQFACYYAQLHGYERWSEAEPYIQKSPEYGYRYARSVIRGRWKEAEPAIRSNMLYWETYCSWLAELLIPQETKVRWILDEGVTNNLFEILNRMLINKSFWEEHPPEERPKWINKTIQELLIKGRPDLITQIQYLHPDLAKKYQHELSLGKLDL